MDGPSGATAAAEAVGQGPQLPASGAESETGEQAQASRPAREGLQCQDKSFLYLRHPGWLISCHCSC